MLLLLLRFRVVRDIPVLNDDGFLPLFALVALVVKVDDVADAVVFEDEKFFWLLVAFFFFDVVLGIVTRGKHYSLSVHLFSPCHMC